MVNLKCYLGYHRYGKWMKIGAFLSKNGFLVHRRCNHCGSIQEKAFTKKSKIIYSEKKLNVVNNLRLD